MRLSSLEPIARPLPRPGEIRAGVTADTVAAAAIAMILSATGTFAILLTIGREAGLSAAFIGSLAAVVYGLGGLTTIALSIIYRQPITVLWTIAGATLLPAALTHMSYPEAMGACIVTSAALVLLGLSGSIQRLTDLIPLPVALGMLLGVFLPFGTRMVTSVANVPEIAGPTVAAFLLVTGVPTLKRRCPPILAAVVVGIAAVALFQPVDTATLPALRLAHPRPMVPVFHLDAILSLAPAMILTVIAIHNAQSFAVLRARGFLPPVNATTVWIGGISALNALFGGIPAAVATVHTALFSAAGPKTGRFVAAILFGCYAILLGIFAPMVADLALILPGSLTATLAGLALLGVLEDSFSRAFAGSHRFAALVTFLVSASGIAPFGLSSAFWALLAGLAIVWTMDRPQAE
ncbi:benzoate membrane transport protein [Amorphus suaedae]